MVVGVPKDHPTKGDPGLTLVEAQSHFSMWCMFPAMLMATNDVRKRDKDIENILFNKETIAVNRKHSIATPLSQRLCRTRKDSNPLRVVIPTHVIIADLIHTHIDLILVYCVLQRTHGGCRHSKSSAPTATARCGRGT
jgi:hypothetical protein